MIEHGAAEPMAGYVLGVNIMGPDGSTFHICMFVDSLQYAGRLLADFNSGKRLSDGYTVREAFVAPSPVRIPAGPTRMLGARA